jgi:N-acetylmuramoyl-L-alanine amidase
MPTADAALARLCDPAAKVSAHYLIAEDGAIHPLVDEAHRAWHAGVSAWRGIRDVNSASVGIEIANPGHEWGYVAFPDAQIAALTELCQAILRRHGILPWNVVGHSDIAPARKQDPGELFPWQQLAGQGIGFWPAAAACTVEEPTVSDAALIPLLARYGYDVTDAAAAEQAFLRHFHPERLGQGADCESWRRLVWLVNAVTAHELNAPLLAEVHYIAD